MSMRYVTEYHDLTLVVSSASAWLGIGLLIGVVYFLTLQWNVRMMMAGSSLLAASGLQLVRLAAMAAALGFIASHFGALALLASGAGIQAASFDLEPDRDRIAAGHQNALHPWTGADYQTGRRDLGPHGSLGARQRPAHKVPWPHARRAARSPADGSDRKASCQLPAWLDRGAMPAVDMIMTTGRLDGARRAELNAALRALVVQLEPRPTTEPDAS